MTGDRLEDMERDMEETERDMEESERLERQTERLERQKYWKTWFKEHSGLEDMVDET